MKEFREIEMTPSDLDAMVRTVYGEARSESVEGKIAVFWVILNRARKPGWWGQSPAEICYKPWQFSCWNQSDPNREVARNLSVNSKAYGSLLNILAEILCGNWPDPTDRATHYYNPKAVRTPTWAEGRTPTTVIGAHHFFAGVE